MMIDVPIIMYHSVGTVDPRWQWHFLTIPWQAFEDHLAFLQARGYRSITLAEFHAFKTGQASLPAKPVVFTFDDGYLDNWVFAAPLLQRYGFRGTIFVNPDFVDPGETCRPTLEDCRAGRVREEDLPGLGFLSWAEMRAMERSGVMDIQSHAMTHTWYPAGPTIVDFRHPGDGFIWMGWNAAPERKWDYLPDGARLPARYGEPVYEHQKSMACRRYLPDPDLADHLAAAVAAAAAGFFERPDWRVELQREVVSHRQAHASNERQETTDEYLARLDAELGGAKRVIEEKLDKRVEFLCWPGGGYGPEALQIARRYYKASTLATADQGMPGFDESGHFRIRRLGVPCLQKGTRYVYPGGRYLYHWIREAQGSRFHRMVRGALKLATA